MPLWDYDTEPNSQLENDTLAVFVDKTKKLEEFSLDYQVKIRSTWKYSAHKYASKTGLDAPRSPETLDIV